MGQYWWVSLEGGRSNQTPRSNSAASYEGFHYIDSKHLWYAHARICHHVSRKKTQIVWNWEQINSVVQYRILQSSLSPNPIYTVYFYKFGKRNKYQLNAENMHCKQLFHICSTLTNAELIPADLRGLILISINEWIYNNYVTSKLLGNLAHNLSGIWSGGCESITWMGDCLTDTTHAITLTIHWGLITTLSRRKSLSKYCTVPRSSRNLIACFTWKTQEEKLIITMPMTGFLWKHMYYY